MNIEIYKITCLKNGMSYIGLTNDSKRRWKEHQTGYGSKEVYSAIKRFGIQNFTFEVLMSGLDNYYSAAKWEIYFIEKFQTYGRRGWNLSKGGETPLGNLYKFSTMAPAQSQIEINRRQNKKDLKKKQQQARKEIDKLRRRKK